MKAKHLVFVALAALLAHPAAAFDEGIVKGKNVNVRGQAYLNSEVVTQLQEGERVIIIEKVKASRPSGKYTHWYKIALPGNTPVWVHGQYVTDGKVTANRLNVRSGPGEKFSVLGHIAMDTAVTEIRRMDPWLEIESPESVYGYVVTDLIEAPRPAPPAVVSAAEPVPPTTPIATEPVTVAPPTTISVVTPESAPIPANPITPPTAAAPADAIPMPATFSEITTSNPDVQTVQTETLVTSTAPVVEPNALLTAPVGNTVTTETEVTYRVVDPDKKKGTIVGNWFKKVFSRKKKATADAEGNADAEEASPGDQKFHDAPEGEAGPPAVRYVTREGKVVRAWNIQAPSDWALQEIYTGRVINYLWTTHTNIPWKELTGRVVRVTGEEAIERRWQRTPVLHIQTLKTIDAEDDE